MRKIALLILVVILVGCNATTPGDPDYRDAFVGEYFGIQTSTSWSLNGPTTSSEIADTILVSMVGDSSLMIESAEFTIGVDGEIFEQGGGSISSYYSASFYQDSLQIDVNGGGLGGGYHTTFKGKK